MADTIRTKTELLALAPIGTAGAISAQDLRDMLVSILGCYGAMGFTNNANTQAIALDTPEVLTGDDGASMWVAGVSDGITVTPALGTQGITIVTAGVYEISLHVSFQGVATKIHEFFLYKDGVTTGVSCRRYTSSNDVGSCSFSAFLTLAAAEVLTIWVEGTGNGNIVIEECQFTVRRIG